MDMAVDVVTGHLDALLTSYATGYRLPGFLSDLLFPRVLVPDQTGRYYKFGREAQEKLGQSLRKKGSGAQQITEVVSDDTYTSEDHSYASVLAAEDEAASKIGNLLERRTRLCSRRVLLDKEAEAFAAITNVSLITQYDSLDDAAEQWIDLENSNPLTNVEVAREAILDGCGEDPNVMVIGKTVFAALRQHTLIRDAFKYTTPGSIGLAQIASYFGIANAYYARGSYLTKAGVVTRFIDKDVFLAYVSPAEGMEDPSFGKSFFWEGAPNAVGGVGTLVGPLGVPSAESREVSVHMWFGQKVTMPGAAYVIKKAGG
jgi:hypothetical protein